MQAFNLQDEPWIITTNLQGEEDILSIKDVLTRSHEIKTLSGEVSAQDVAILRLLLAVLYAIYTRTAEYEAARDDESEEACLEIWGRLWQRGRFPEQEVNCCLAQYHDRFWLIHPERPFYQMAEIKKGSEFPASKMIGELVESNNKAALFPVRSGRGKESLPPAEAARWLVYLNCFDDAAAKKVQKDLGSMSVGWLAGLGLVCATGSNLFETLMLNFVLSIGGRPWGRGQAAWELETPRTAERPAISPPESAEELFTLQSRRVQLKWKDGHVTGYVMLGGDQLSSEDLFIEPMTTWRRNKGKAGRGDYHSPPSNLSKNPSKQLWRDFAPLLANTEGDRQPGIIRWLALLEGEGLIESRQLRLCTLSVKYGNMQNGIDDTWTDTISINAGLLSALNNEWITRITTLVETTEDMVKTLGSLVRDIAISEGASDGAGRKTAAEELAYAALDLPFRSWLAGIKPGEDDIEDTIMNWKTLAKSIITKHGEKLVSQAGTKAFVGKEEEVKGKKRLYNAPLAFAFFKNRIHKIATS